MRDVHSRFTVLLIPRNLKLFTCSTFIDVYRCMCLCIVFGKLTISSLVLLSSRLPVHDSAKQLVSSQYKLSSFFVSLWRMCDCQSVLSKGLFVRNNKIRFRVCHIRPLVSIQLECQFCGLFQCLIETWLEQEWQAELPEIAWFTRRAPLGESSTKANSDRKSVLDVNITSEKWFAWKWSQCSLSIDDEFLKPNRSTHHLQYISRFW